LTKNKPSENQKPIRTTPRTTMGCHLSKPTTSHDKDEFEAPSGQDAGRGNSLPLEHSHGASVTASMELSEAQPATIVRGAPLQDPLAGSGSCLLPGSLALSEVQLPTPLQNPLAGSLVLSEGQPATIRTGAPPRNQPAGHGAQPVDSLAPGNTPTLDPQDACGPACFPRELPTFVPIMLPHDSGEPGASSASPTLSAQSTLRSDSVLRSASTLRSPKVVSFVDCDARSHASSLALEASSGSSGMRQRPAAVRRALQTLQQRSSVPATPQQGSVLSENKKQALRCAAATPRWRMLLPAPPHRGSLKPAVPQQR
jgi:hypothetical protein